VLELPQLPLHNNESELRARVQARALFPGYSALNGVDQHPIFATCQRQFILLTEVSYVEWLLLGIKLW
jgi:hypothetical protein